VRTLSSILKRWLRELQEPLISVTLLERMNDNESSDWMIRAVLALPNQQRDTLMYFIGFLQHLSEFEAATKMNAMNLAACLHPVLAKLPPPAELSDDGLHLYRRLERFVICLIEDWDTTAVYDPDAV
jgi:hypothetical protein